jgi:hypothetical protein
VTRAREKSADRRLDVVPSDDGFIVRIGAVCLSLDRDAAEELMCLLADALEPGDFLAIASFGSN